MKNKNVEKLINSYFEENKLLDSQIFSVLRLYIYTINSQTYNSDLPMLAKLLQPEELSKIIEYFNGDIIKIPTKVEYRESLFLSLCFYLKEVKGWNWIQIKEYINLSEADKELLSSISLGKKINAIKDHMGKDMMDLIKNMDIEQLQDVLNGVQI